MSDILDVPAGRTPYIYLDFCFYAYCNFTCTYCRANNFGMSRGEGRAAVEDTLSAFLEKNSAAVLKLSGYGEATLWRDLPETIALWAGRFPIVQLISNGAGSRVVLDRLCQLSNFQASITLDGHTPELDRFRTRGDEKLHRRVVETLRFLVHVGVGVEINCVLSQANADALDTYLAWIQADLGPAVTLVPMPVRPTMGRSMKDIRDNLFPSPDQIDRLEETLVYRNAEFSDVLAPLAYLQAAVQFMRTSRRAPRCHIHRANFGVNTKLLALPCACAGDRLISPLGPVSAVGVDTAIERRRREYLVGGGVGAKCQTCFTHYDIINLYFNGLVTEHELEGIPSLSHPGVLAHLRAVKRDVLPYL